MPQPTLAAVHIDRPLTNLSIAFMQAATKYISGQIFPRVPVQKKSDLFFNYSRADWNIIAMEKRGISTESAGSGFDITTQTYDCDVWSLHKDIDEQIEANQDVPINLRRDSTRYLVDNGLKRLDREWATTFFQSGVWDTDVTPATLWSAAGSTPIDDISAEMERIEEATGFLPNTLVLGARVWRTLKNHSDFIGRVSGGATVAQTALVSPQKLAEVLELDRVLIARGVENTAVEGAAETSAYIFNSRDALLVYSAPAPSILMPSAGYTFVWSGLIGGGAGQRIKTFRIDRLNSDRVEIDMAFDQNLVSSDLATFFDGAVA